MKLIVRRADNRDIPAITELLIQVDMVHHNGRPDLFKGPATKYNSEELENILAREDTPVFVCVDENDVALGHAFCIHKQIKGDIVLTDIRMPGINGIDAIKEIRKRNEGIIFIVISAYDKFGYAQEAINLGVMDYLNKPVDKNQFIQTIKKAMLQVDGEREKRSRELEILEKMETVTPIIENGLIYNLLFQDFYKEDIENFKKVLEIDANYGYMIALVFGEQQENGFMTNAVGSSVKIQNQIRDLREIIKSYFQGIIGAAMANKIAIFIPYEKKEFDYNERI